LSFATPAEWQEVAANHPPPCLVVLCVKAQRTTKAEFEQQIASLASAGSSPVVILSDRDDADQVLDALDAGAKGFMPTSISLEVASEALHLVRAGGTFVPASSLLASRTMSGQKAGGGGFFTERQAAVVEKLSQGKPNKIIAYELDMQESTVKVHIRNIMRKLKATNRTEVAFLYQSMTGARGRAHDVGTEPAL
jgi:DNA-binding NarL/FixJ family response regulator